MKLSSIITGVLIMLLSTYTNAQHPRSALDLTWRKAASLPPAPGQAAALGYAGPVAGASGNKMLLAGGANFPEGMPWDGGKKKYYDRVVVLEKKGKHVRPLDNNFMLPEPIAYAAVCTTPRGIFYAGGENENGISRKVYMLNWDQSLNTVLVTALPDFPYPVTNASAAVLGERVYVAGGEKVSGVSDQLWVLDLADTSAGWQEGEKLPQPVSHFVFAGALVDKEPVLYLAGGRTKKEKGVSDFYNSFYSYNTRSHTWTQQASLPYALAAGTGILLPDGCFYLLGGDKGTIFREVESLMAAAAAETSTIKKQELISRKNHLQRAHPGFSREVICYDPVTASWRNAGMIPFATPVTTTAFRWQNCVIIPTGEIRAGVRTPDIISFNIPRKHR